MRKLKILQLAAYQSNIGDNANISGIRRKLSESFASYQLEFHDWDIVNFSWSLSDFSPSNLDWINSFDIFIIGGGGFLEIIPGTTTWTGTRINIPQEIFEKITTLTVFYAIGIDTVRADLDGRPISEEIEKFRNFVDFVNNKENFILSTRHDGSTHVIERLLGPSYRAHFDLVPDGGFYATHKEYEHPEINSEKLNIAINFGGDLIDARFPQDYTSEPTANNPLNLSRPSDYESTQYLRHSGYTKFLVSFANVIRSLSFDLDNIQFVYIPHIYRDIENGFHLLSELGFPYCRREVFMAPYVQGFTGKDYILDTYKKCDLSIGMRFHANVCPIGMNTPSIGLGTFPMIKALYNALELSEQYIAVGAGADWEAELYKRVLYTLKNSVAISANYKKTNAQLSTLSEIFHEKIKTLGGF